jgi:uncharacterized membrane protein
MKIDWKDKSTWFAVVLLAGAVFLILYKIGNYFGLDKNTWAAWVQAVGSIAAIVGAIWISKNQHIKDRELEVEKQRKADLQILEAIAALIARASATCELLLEAWNVDQAARLGLGDQIADAKQAIDRLPYFEIPNARLVTHIALLPRSLGMLEDRLRLAMQSQQELSQELRQAVGSSFADAQSMLNNAQRICVQELRIRN